MIRRLLLLAALLAAPLPAWAGALTVRVVDEGGRPISDAVVTLRPVGQPGVPGKVGGPYQVIQQDTRFKPFVLVVPAGATVAFPNLDPFRHHVYSFSPAKRFELKQFARDQTRSVTFDRPGIVSIGCNIHDQMSAYLYVADTAWAAASGTNGTVTFRDTPRGTYALEVWHPYLRAPGNVVRRQAQFGADRSESVAVRLRPPPMHAMGGY